MKVAADDLSPPTAHDAGKAAKHVLVIDDDAEIVESIKAALKLEGLRVSVARDGNQGLAITETEKIDLLILDMMMPKRSGFLVLEWLRQSNQDPFPVIMITGNEGIRHREYAELLGVDDYINKPFTMDQLINSVNRRLKSSDE